MGVAHYFPSQRRHFSVVGLRGLSRDEARPGCDKETFESGVVVYTGGQISIHNSVEGTAADR